MPAAKQIEPSVRKHVLDLLRGGGAHVDFEAAIARFPVALRGVKAAGVPHTAWQLLEHMRIAQWDILEFSRNSKHVSPEFPDGYWPPANTPPTPNAWSQSMRAFRADLRAMMALVANPKTDLFARIPHGEGQTLLREALLVADHNSYHVGQLVLLRKVLEAWPARTRFSI
jgi:DinB family protein